MNIMLNNCNNIDHGEINVQENILNIKYALNGTGKSTIAKAIILHRDEKKLEELIPFKHRGEMSFKPEIEGLPEDISFAVFNEDYVNQYVFLPDELVKNSFEIFIKDDHYTKQQEEIESLIGEIKNLFNENSSVNNLLSVMQGFSDNFKATKTGFSGAGILGKGLAKGNKLAHIPEGLERYTPFLHSTSNVKWLEWQISGQGYMDITTCCPFCSDEKFDEKKPAVEKIKKEYEPQYIKHLTAMLQLLEDLGQYLSDAAQSKILIIKNNISDMSPEQKEYLANVHSQIDKLRERLIKMKSFGFFSFKNVDDLEKLIAEQKIDIQFLTELNSSKTSNEITIINNAIDSIIGKIGKLKGEINKQNQLLIRKISKYQTEINDFLKYAGYSYLVVLEEKIEGNYKLLLRHKDFSNIISSGKSTLSFGERNAFALVLFMYEVLRNDPSIIILADPISSFDGNKKFAILNKLFMGSDNFNGKTVLLLTHEFSTVLDIKKNLPSKFSANAYYLSNKNGVLTEKLISSNNVISYKQIALKNIAESTSSICKIVYLRRLYEFEEESHLGYQVLSNVFKKRKIPAVKIGDIERQMTEEELHEGSGIIDRIINGFSYKDIISQVSDTKKMIDLYKSLTNGYEKLQVYRIIKNDNNDNDVVRKFVNETFHIENDYLFQLNPCEYEIIPSYIIQECDNDLNEIINKCNKEQLNG